MKTGQPQIVLKSPPIYDHVNSISFSPDGTRVMAGSWDGALMVWDVQTGRLERMTAKVWDRVHHSPLRAVLFSPDGRIFAASGDRIVALWDAQTGTSRGLLELSAGAVNDVTLSSASGQVACAHDDGTVRV